MMPVIVSTSVRDFIVLCCSFGWYISNCSIGFVDEILAEALASECRTC